MIQPKFSLAQFDSLSLITHRQGRTHKFNRTKTKSGSLLIKGRDPVEVSTVKTTSSHNYIYLQTKLFLH